MANKEEFLDVTPIICIDCGQEIELPSHRIKTNNSYKFICDECNNKKGGK